MATDKKVFASFIQNLASMSAESYPRVLSQDGRVTVTTPYLIFHTNHVLVEEGYYTGELQPIYSPAQFVFEDVFEKAKEAWRNRCEFVIDVHTFLKDFTAIAKVERKHAKQLTVGYYGKILVGFLNNPNLNFLFGGIGLGHVEDYVHIFQTKIALKCHVLSSLSIADKTFASFYSWNILEGLLTLGKALRFKYLHFSPSTPTPGEFWWSESRYFPAFFAFSDTDKPYYESLETHYLSGFIMPVKHIVPIGCNLFYGGEA